MKYLYHYCATWIEEAKLCTRGGVMISPDTVCFANYGDFVAAIAREIGQEQIVITSLSYLGSEE
jgi:hypothetical protein